MSWAAGGAALASGVLVAVGGDALRALLRLRAACGPERIGLAFACGSVALALAAALLSAFGTRSTSALLGGGFAATIGAALALAFVVLWLTRRRAQPAAEGTSARAGWLGFLPALAVVALAFWLADQRPVWNIDAQKRWVMHGRWLAEHGSLLPAQTQDPLWATTYPQYPPLVPAFVGLALALGADADTGVRALFPFFFLALLGVLYGRARSTAGEPVACALTLAFALTPCFAWLDHRGNALGLGADAALADVALALFLGGLAASAAGLLEGLRAPGAAACAVFAIGATATKREGSVSALAILALALAAGLRRRREAAAQVAHSSRRARHRLVAAVIACLAVHLGWTWLARDVAIEPGSEGANFASLAALGGGIERLPAIARFFARELGDLSSWGLLWWSVPLWSALAWWRAGRASERRTALLALAWTCSGLLLAAAAFATTTWSGGDFESQMEVSATRLFMHHAPIAALIAIEACRRREDGLGTPA